MTNFFYLAAILMFGFVAEAQQVDPQDQIDNQNVTRDMNNSPTGNKFDSYGAKRDATLDRIIREAPEKPSREAPEKPSHEIAEKPKYERADREFGISK